jgi:serine protease AprX
MAPDARIVSVKVGTADGGTDVTQVIAAIDWVVQHARDPGFNIRVINLSYGTNTTQSYLTDPLPMRPSRRGKRIVVVAAAGNDGYQKGAGAACMADPAYDPYVIAVAGVDTMGTRSTGDDVVGNYSSSGTNAAGCKPPDFAAPGSHMQGLRVAGSFIDQTHPEGLLGTTNFRGTGTSMATAVISGAVALVLQKYPNLTPDQVKQFFAANAAHMPGANAWQEGTGEIQLATMLTSTPAAATQSFTASTGTGSIELSRGTDHIAINGVVLTGEKDIFGKAVVTPSLAALEAPLVGGSWNGHLVGNTWSATPVSPGVRKVVRQHLVGHDLVGHWSGNT